MNVLVAVASRHGATTEIAQALGRAIGQEGLSVTVAPAEDVLEVAAQDAFVVGSAVYMGRWLHEAVGFVDANVDLLAARPTWLFSSGPIGDPPRPQEPDVVNVEDLIARTGAREHRLFAGKLDPPLLGFGERVVMRAFRAREGDYRDWAAIEEWGRAIARELQP